MIERAEIARGIDSNFSEEFYAASCSEYERLYGEAPFALTEQDISFCMAPV